MKPSVSLWFRGYRNEFSARRPPPRSLEATLEDVSKADAKAEVIGQARIEQPGNPPIRFEIPYDSSRIDPRHRYSVRARILVDGKHQPPPRSPWKTPTGN